MALKPCSATWAYVVMANSQLSSILPDYRTCLSKFIRKQSGQIVLAIASADLLDQAFLLLGEVSGFFVPDFHGLMELGEIIRYPFVQTEPFGVVCGRKSGQLIRTCLAREGGPIIVRAMDRVINPVGDTILRIRDDGLGLRVPVCLGGQHRVWLATAIPNGEGFQWIAEGIHLQRQGMAHTRIGRVALVVITQAF